VNVGTRFGVCNWVFGDEELTATAAFLAQEGFDGIELMGDLDLYTPGEVNAVLDDHGLSVLSLTPQDVDLAHPDPATRHEALDYYLRLLDFAAAVGAPVVSCHGAVGRVRALADFDEEYQWLLTGVQQLAARATPLNLRLAMEVLNRYESHLLNTGAQACAFVTEVGSPSVGVLLDAYHMNIEEAEPAAAIQEAGGRLFLFHAADSNRQAVGRGHTDFPALASALHQMGYTGDVVFECTAVGPDPFTPVKGAGWIDEVRMFARESLSNLKVILRQAAASSPAISETGN
jgi:sugar phosphate isomerase/epimerase